METALSITKKYPKEQYNLLGNTDVMVNIPEIKSPVVQVVKLDTNPEHGDIYLQKEGYKDRNGNVHPDLWAITKNGLKKLADGAGIKMISSEHVIPSTCQKCIAINKGAGQVIRCGECRNQDVAYRVTISVPQLTGEVLTVTDTNEIIVKNATANMTEAQVTEFLRHLPQICEAKALNGAIRTALHIKGTYLIQELQKPFIVAYLVPNLDQEDVKKAAIESMFQSTAKLFGAAPETATPSVAQIESKVPETHAAEAGDCENYDQYIDGNYSVQPDPQPAQPDYQNNQASYQPAPAAQPQERPQRSGDFYCDKCGKPIPENVWNYSVEHFSQPLCFECQKKVRAQRRA